MAEGITQTILYILGIGVVIFLVSMLLKEKRMFLPLITSLISVLLIIISFFVGTGWGGLGFMYMSFNALVASIINLFIMTMITKSKTNK